MNAVLWIALGAAAGALSIRPTGLVVPGGYAARLAIGMLGGFVGGATTYLAFGGGSLAADLASPPAALMGGAILLVIVARAARLDRSARGSV